MSMKWWPFRRRRTIESKAQSIADGLVTELVYKAGNGCATTLAEAGYTTDPAGRVQLGVEILIVYLCMLDLLAFSKLGPEKRSSLMDHVYAVVYSDLSATSFNDLLTTGIENTLNTVGYLEAKGNVRLSEYSAYQEWIRKDGPPNGTLFWEAAKIIAQEVYKSGNKASCVVPLSLLMSHSLLNRLDASRVNEALDE